MIIKKICAILTAFILASLPTIPTMAAVMENDDATNYTQKVVSQNIIGGPTGNASIIPEDDPLLDGKFYNGELVNGEICYNKLEAEKVLASDLANMNKVSEINSIEAEKEMAAGVYIYPITGSFVGIDNEGFFAYTIHESGSGRGRTSAKSKIAIKTQSRLYSKKTDSTYTDDEQSFIVTLTGPDGVVGSYRGYADDVKGGYTFEISQGVGIYNVKVTVSGLSRDIYLNGSGTADL